MNQKIYYNPDSQQVSLDQINWVGVDRYDDYQQPIFMLNGVDWCSIRTSKSGEWLICFAKFKSEYLASPSYFQSFVKTKDAYQGHNKLVVFDCYEVSKNPATGRWERERENTGLFA